MNDQRPEISDPKKSDLGVRAASAVVMIAVAGAALWLGGWVWLGFVALVALGVLWEWWGLVQTIAGSKLALALWMVAGVIYCGAAIFILGFLLAFQSDLSLVPVILIVSVIGTDIGAYFAGRAVGGPKIAPRISPSKTWAGLMGGMGMAALIVNLLWGFFDPVTVARSWPELAAIGASLAVVAQIGDFFESWMKRRAGVKDSSHLIPGHGGLFDRADGLLSVSFFALILEIPAILAGTFTG